MPGPHTQRAQVSVMPVLRNESQRILAMLQTGAFQRTPLIHTSQNESQARRTQHNEIRTGKHLTQPSNQNIKPVKEDPSGGPDQKIAYGEKERAASRVRSSFAINGTMKKQRGVCRWQHHGDHHDEPHPGKGKKTGHTRPAFHTERHGDPDLHHESHIVRRGPGQQPRRSGEDNDNDK